VFVCDFSAQSLIEETSPVFELKEALSEESVPEEPKVEEEPSTPPPPPPEEEEEVEDDLIQDVEMAEESPTVFQVSDCIDSISKGEESPEKEEILSELVDKIDGTVIETPISSIVVPLEQHQENNVETANLFDIAQQISNGT